MAVEHARLYEEARYRQQWLEANSEIVAGLLPDAEETHVLAMIVGHAVRILSADLGVLVMPVDGDRLRVELASGVDAVAHRGLVLPRRGSFAGAAITAKGPLISHDIEHDPRVTVGPPRWSGLGPAVAVPMATGERVRGVLQLARLQGRESFTEPETGPLLTFAGQAALAMELAERRIAAGQVALLRDRERIARDPHDLAIQRLFATGMTLQSAIRFVDHPEASDRLLRAVEDLDETIKIIRSTVFGLRTPDPVRGRKGLRSQTVNATEEASHVLGFTQPWFPIADCWCDVPSGCCSRPTTYDTTAFGWWPPGTRRYFSRDLDWQPAAWELRLLRPAVLLQPGTPPKPGVPSPPQAADQVYKSALHRLGGRADDLYEVAHLVLRQAVSEVCLADHADRSVLPCSWVGRAVVRSRDPETPGMASKRLPSMVPSTWPPGVSRRLGR
ncbi:sensor histidine kinase [Streptomyces noursei]|uniref:sensor histidine kinase n=1 Tax=Streptomyces noursei TaxID=1971 RepID=UPI0028A2694C